MDGDDEGGSTQLLPGGPSTEIVNAVWLGGDPDRADR
jgi:hypothetical protein